MPEALHEPLPKFVAIVIAFEREIDGGLEVSSGIAQVVAGAAVFVGAFVPLMSIPMVIVLLVAIVKVHWQFGFSSIKFLAVTAEGLQFGKPGVECDFLYLAAIAALFVAGADPWSVDYWRRGSRIGAVELSRRQ